MRDRTYYSVRTGVNPSGGRLDFEGLKRVFEGLYSHWEKEGYFDEAFGSYCPDNGSTAGSLGEDIEGVLLLHLQKGHIWPVQERLSEYSEDDLFDVIEFLNDYVSNPVERTYHSWAEHWHCEKFDKITGQLEFHEKVNNLLKRYKDGFELSLEGEIFAVPDAGLEPLVSASLKTSDPGNIDKRVEEAKVKFRRRTASNEDRRDAIRDLADVLEYIRPEIKKVLTSKDEADLFELANSFGIRHHNSRQKGDYDQDIWFSWMFYYYLATIHAAVRLIARQKQTKQSPTETPTKPLTQSSP